MASEVWKARKDIHEQVTALVAKYHPDLADPRVNIAVIFHEKKWKSGGKVMYGDAFRASPTMNALSGEDHTFILRLAADGWENDLTSRQREALLDHLLSSCRADEISSGSRAGELRCHIVRPDIQVFSENIERYGMWMPKTEEEEEKDKEKGPPTPNEATEQIKASVTG